MILCVYCVRGGEGTRIIGSTSLKSLFVTVHFTTGVVFTGGIQDCVSWVVFTGRIQDCVSGVVFTGGIQDWVSGVGVVFTEGIQDCVSGVVFTERIQDCVSGVVFTEGIQDYDLGLCSQWESRTTIWSCVHSGNPGLCMCR